MGGAGSCESASEVSECRNAPERVPFIPWPWRFIGCCNGAERCNHLPIPEVFLGAVMEWQ